VTPPDDSWTHDWLGHSLVLGGIAVAAAGVVTWNIGRDEAQRTRGAATYGQWMTSYGDAGHAETFERVGVAAAAVGVGAALAGIVHYVWPHRRAEPRPAGLAIRF
jgi:hypothetical protein